MLISQLNQCEVSITWVMSCRIYLANQFYKEYGDIVLEFIIGQIMNIARANHLFFKEFF